eukprot:CAMPEP_0119551110 /NCGR_PEP_ID=MMETSP1352-20130426/4463_1 /TAXON_ID=265584 /ORGANISM="Stauroneis constricta, Strain CCMP1120" /LENGTH=864 /DNA_ID=CAMNT_0007597119 /DNA_START=14 /DNA_END=2608 /DNA_ORIENTATION=+
MAPSTTTTPVKPAPRRSARLRSAAQTTAAAKPAAAAATTTTTAKRKATGGKRKTATAAAAAPARTQSQPPKKTRKTGLTKAVTDTSAPLGVIDPEANIKGAILTLHDEACDAMLVQVDPAKSMDKYFILQLIESSSRRKKKRFAVYTRWGRTGSKGQAQLAEFDDVHDATKFFEDKFHDKTGLTWATRSQPTKGNKYRYIEQDFEQKQGGYTAAKWQYWVDDGVDNKIDGWYDYDEEASKLVEQLFHEHAKNKASNIGGRSIDSGMYAYDVDLQRMIQTNVKHANRTQRRIRRHPVDADLDNSPPPALSSATDAASAPIITVSSSATGNKVAPATPNVPTSSTAATVSPPSPPAAAAAPPAKKGGGSHPVDPDISIIRKNVADYHVVQNGDGLWYDAVLNQCNIGGNNNKYYRLQCLEDNNGRYYTWFRWGRVGEASRASASTWSGPYSSMSSATKEFCKKYKAKSANTFGVEPFVPRTGKYTLIEIDNDVEVSDEYKVTPANQRDVEYEKCKLDGKTEELISVLFSQDMRNDALSAFNLDLKRLPLGVPSQNQINQGVDILTNIEKKLNGDAVRSSYQQLSSDFYTAIPHSFGRTRPPIIRTKEALRSRFDMCNILLDMYDSNETVRRIQREEQEEMAKKEILPNPIDQHYKSLSADLKLVDSQSMEFKAIKECFLKTGGQSRSSQLLNVWAVNRDKEAERFEKFENVDNRRLLWHGTNIAVVAPIITSGLRIMPHSGGRVGSGIYLASMQEKSAQYTSGYGSKFACMFLCEAPLGKQHPVESDGPHAYSLKTAPTGFDSVHAKGRIQPKKWANMTIDGKSVKIAQGDCKDEAKHKNSSFYHDEFLVYNEAQVRLRYVLTIKL